MNIAGRVFVSLPAADVAADAVDKFKSSTVDSKELFVKVLPNIHVSICSNKVVPRLYSPEGQPMLEQC